MKQDLTQIPQTRKTSYRHNMNALNANNIFNFRPFMISNIALKIPDQNLNFRYDR